MQGGGAFVLIYFSIFAIAIPIAAAELVIDGGGAVCQQAIKNIAVESGKSPSYALIGTLGVLGSFFADILCRDCRLGDGLYCPRADRRAERA